MNYNDLYKTILEILPEATFGEDSEGQIIIYTNKMEILLPGGKTTGLVDFEDQSDDSSDSFDSGWNWPD